MIYEKYLQPQINQSRGHHADTRQTWGRGQTCHRPDDRPTTHRRSTQDRLVLCGSCLIFGLGIGPSVGSVSPRVSSVLHFSVLQVCVWGLALITPSWCDPAAWPFTAHYTGSNQSTASVTAVYLCAGLKTEDWTEPQTQCPTAHTHTHTGNL